MRHTTDDTDLRSDPELITLVRGGDRDAYGVLYERHSAAAANLARQFTRNPAEVDDLVAEAFAKVLTTLLAGGGPDMAFRAYLFTTMRHTAIDRGRKDSKVQYTDDLTPHERPAQDDDPVVLQAESTIVARAFASLPQRWQTVLWHTQVEQQPPAEVGVLLGMTPNAVTSLAFRAREGLREAYLQAHLAETDADPCRATVARLGSWARGGLSRREQAQVDEHLESCDKCRALAAELQSINTSLRALIGPVLLGAAAVGYFATSSAAAAAGLTAAGTAASGSAGSGGGTSGGGAPNFLTNPWTWIASGAAACTATAVVLALTVWGGSPPDSRADPPPAVTVSTSQAPSSPSAPPPATTDQPPATPPATDSPVTSSPASPPQSSVPSRTSALSPSSTPLSPGETAVDREIPVAPPVTIEPAETTPAPPARTPSSPSVTSSSRPTTPSTTTHPVTSSSTPTSQTPSTTPAPTSPSIPPTTPAPTPTGPDLTAPTVSASSIAGTAGAPVSVDFSVTNSGDTASPDQRATIGMPSGVTLADADARSDDAAPAFHRRAALLAGPDAEADQHPVRCRESICRYSVPAHSTLTVTLTFDVAPDAQDGAITITAGRGAGAVTMLSVAPALTGFTLGDSTTTLRAGETLTDVAITATVAAPVTNPGTVTLPLRTDGLWITDYPDDCAANRAGTSITCVPTSMDSGAATFGPFGVSALPRASGIAHITVDLPGGRHAPLQAAGPSGSPGAPLTIAPQGPGDPTHLTGPFGATLVGAPAMECNTAGITRGHCPPPGIDPLPGNNPLPAMMAARHPQQIEVPTGATVISATLTWAMTYPEDGDPANLNAVTFHVGAPGCSAPCTAHEIDATEVYPPIVNDQGEPADVDRQWYVRAADVTRWVTGSATVWADGLRAVSTTPSGGSTPMAGWTLSVIWTLPGTEATVELADTGTASLSGGAGDHLTLASAGAPITDLTQVLWATDPQAVKQILVDGVPVTGAGMFGYHAHPAESEVDQAPGESGDDGAPGESSESGDDGDQDDDDESGWHGDHGGHGRSDECHESAHGCMYATGMDVVTGITAAEGQAVTFTNEHGYTDGNWANADDQLWLGPTLTVRAAP